MFLRELDRPDAGAGADVEHIFDMLREGRDIQRTVKCHAPDVVLEVWEGLSIKELLEANGLDTKSITLELLGTDKRWLR